MSSTYREVFTDRQRAEEYERSMLHSRSYHEVLWEVEKLQLRAIVDELRATHPRIEYLDFAAGTGRVTAFMEGLVDASTAIEISEQMIAVARAKLSRTTLVCADVTPAGAPVEGAYDLITAFRFVLNAEPRLRLAGLKALAARLRDRTSLLVFNNHGHLPSHKLLMFPVHRVRRAARAREGWSPDWNYMTDSRVRRLANEAGLEVVRRLGCGLLSARVARLIGFERAVRWERSMAGGGPLGRFGGNQMYVARLRQ